MVYNLALKLTGDPQDAEDISQDAFLKAIRGLANFRADADPGSWLYRITVNVWKNRVRSEKRRSFWKTLSLDFWSGSDEESFPRQIADSAPPVGEGLEKEEEKQAVEKAMAELDPEDKAILLLREAEERSYEDIAGIIQVPVGTVKSRISRAREALRSKLAPFLEDKTHGS